MNYKFFFNEFFYFVNRHFKVGKEKISLIKLFNDHDYLKNMLIRDRSKVIDVLTIKYDLLDRDFIQNKITGIYRNHLENPLSGLYIESDLGAPRRHLRLLKKLDKRGYKIRNKSCLDIGCSNGSLLLACLKYGAKDVLGIDITEARLNIARQWCKRLPIRLNNVNILEKDLDEKFDAIFCVDVLEHVSDPVKLIEKISSHLNKERKSFAYLSIFNRNCVKNIFKEPHYGVPGIILLPFEDARNLWHEVREKFNSKLEYTVYHWPFYWDVVKIAKENELDVSLFVNEKKIKMFFYLLKGYKKRSRNFDRRFKNNLDKSPIPDHYKVLIDKYVNEYLDEFKRDHEELMKRKSKKKLNYL